VFSNWENVVNSKFDFREKLIVNCQLSIINYQLSIKKILFPAFILSLAFLRRTLVRQQIIERWFTNGKSQTFLRNFTQRRKDAKKQRCKDFFAP
jgi:hypothetical protein